MMRAKTCKLFVKELYALYKVYPHIAIKIETSLGLKHCHEYLKNLLIKDRSDRYGVSNNIYCQILNLYLLHVDEFGDFDSPLLITNANLAAFESEIIIA